MTNGMNEHIHLAICIRSTIKPTIGLEMCIFSSCYWNCCYSYNKYKEITFSASFIHRRNGTMHNTHEANVHTDTHTYIHTYTQEKKNETMNLWKSIDAKKRQKLNWKWHTLCLFVGEDEVNMIAQYIDIIPKPVWKQVKSIKVHTYTFAFLLFIAAYMDRMYTRFGTNEWPTLALLQFI